ncbi:MAG: peptide deformylase [Flavobacteriales bacterium]|nr:peptide deformylase [Flavobacteriales bacterium]
MILPIRAYGDSILRKKCKTITKDYPNLQQLIADMFETMDESDGVGLAAPQIGLDIRMFVIDSSLMHENEKDGIRKVFINAEMIDEYNDTWEFEEGCLSIPKIRENVARNGTIKLKFQDENFKTHEEIFDGLTARVIQHEYDHIEGILFIDHISALKRRLLKGKLADITAGKVSVNYRMKFPKK